jgi:hypothetical protein
MRKVYCFTALLLSSLLSGCATSPSGVQATEENQRAYCPPGSDRKESGKIFIASDPMEGYFSISRETWPWNASMMGKLKQPNPRLKLVCVAPYVFSKGFKQRPAVFVPVDSDETSYVFGATDLNGKPQGVTDESRLQKAQSLVGKTLWFTGSPTTEFYQRLENLKPYRVSRIDTGKAGVCKDILLVVQHNGSDVKLAVTLTPDQKFKPCYGADLYETEPSSGSLSIQPFEYDLIRQRTAATGMSERALMMALGPPDATNRTMLANRISKQYVYGSGRKYVYVENGKVTAIQD